MIVRYTRTALAQLDAVYDYIARDNPSAARGVKQAIQYSIENLALFPHAGRPTNKQNIRRLPVGKHGHVVFYTTTVEAVIILRVLHGR